MNNLVIYVHPNHKSLNYAMYEQVVSGLNENQEKQNVEVLDLYANNFDPILVFNEQKRRRDMHLDPYMDPHREKILWADRIVMVYPIWWGRPPAMLLGYIDRIMSTNFAYKDIGKLMPEGRLKGREVICVSTMKGPTHYPRLLLNNAHQTLMKKAVFNFVGIKKVKFFEFGSMETSQPKREKALNKVYHYFKKI